MSSCLRKHVLYDYNYILLSLLRLVPVTRFLYELLCESFRISGAVNITCELSVLGALHSHIVILDDDESGKVAPMSKHLLSLVVAVSVEVSYGSSLVRAIKLKSVLLHLSLTSEIVSLKAVANSLKLREELRVTRLNHVAHPIAHPESVLV